MKTNKVNNLFSVIIVTGLLFSSFLHGMSSSASSPEEIVHVRVTGRKFEGPEGGQLARANFTGVDWIFGNLVKAQLQHAIFDSTDAKQTRLIWMNFSEAQLSLASFKKAYIKKANFTEARLNDADFTGSELVDVNFAHTCLVGARFDGRPIENFNRYMIQASFTGADLRFARFKFVDITRVVGLDKASVYTTSFESVAMTREQYDWLVANGAHVHMPIIKKRRDMCGIDEESADAPRAVCAQTVTVERSSVAGVIGMVVGSDGIALI